MAKAEKLRSGDEIRLLSGEWVRLVAAPRPSITGRLVLEYASLVTLPNGMPAKVGVITGVLPAEEIRCRPAEMPAAA